MSRSFSRNRDIHSELWSNFGYNQRRGSPVRNHYNSEFAFDGSLKYNRSHSPELHSSKEDSLYSFAQFSPVRKTFKGGEPKTYNSEMPRTLSAPGGHGIQGGAVGSAGASRRGRSASYHKDLRRKMVFDLHREIKKTAHTTMLEEITDIDRITDICLDTLRQMMESKAHRKYLHHMNNSNNTIPRLLTSCVRPDRTNNAPFSYERHYKYKADQSPEVKRRRSKESNYQAVHSAPYSHRSSYGSGSPSPGQRQGRSASHHKDLRRKMVFDLHREVKKKAHTTLLEEINDINRITDICLSTLQSMMESKSQRKYLHHMNNSNQQNHFQGRIPGINTTNNFPATLKDFHSDKKPSKTYLHQAHSARSPLSNAPATTSQLSPRATKLAAMNSVRFPIKASRMAEKRKTNRVGSGIVISVTQQQNKYDPSGVAKYMASCCG